MSVITAVRGFTNLNGVDIIKVRGTLEINDDSSSSHYGYHRFISSPDGPHTLLRRVRDTATAEKLADYIDDILLLRGGDAGDGVFRDEFVVPMSDASETLQTRRGWTKAGAGDSNTLIEAGEYLNLMKAPSTCNSTAPPAPRLTMCRLRISAAKTFACAPA
jgi:hypothetical protein